MLPCVGVVRCRRSVELAMLKLHLWPIDSFTTTVGLWSADMEVSLLFPYGNLLISPMWLGVELLCVSFGKCVQWVGWELIFSEIIWFLVPLLWLDLVCLVTSKGM
ncbi:hypothetical protein MLD38_037724 [Melastoma candidum]|uniref:Uncharacterized protein n=1 Tax=Melastoma candidum TaxID=119954 RepID=A0ACB9LNS8_9MYRT|nr:hypothetical protein MLD38_037724 [Melastoma candidum]